MFVSTSLKSSCLQLESKVASVCNTPVYGGIVHLQSKQARSVEPLQTSWRHLFQRWTGWNVIPQDVLTSVARRFRYSILKLELSLPVFYDLISYSHTTFRQKVFPEWHGTIISGTRMVYPQVQAANCTQAGNIHTLSTIDVIANQQYYLEFYSVSL